MADITPEQCQIFLETYRPRINWNMPEHGMVEIMGQLKSGYGYLFSGRTLREAVQKAKEYLKC